MRVYSFMYQKRCAGPVFTKLFQVQDQDRAQDSKWIIAGLFHIIGSRKHDFCIDLHGKCCFRPKMHKIEVYVGENNYKKVHPVI